MRSPRRARRADTIGRMALAGLVRSPGRTVLGVGSLFAGVAALAILLAVQEAFGGGIVVTALGDYVVVQVRGVDLLAAAITVALGAFAVGDVTYLNINERVDEIGTLRASGWADRHLRRLFATEGVVIAALGAVFGSVLGVSVVSLLLPVGLATGPQASATAAAIGLAAAAVALLAPIARLSQLAPSQAIAGE